MKKVLLFHNSLTKCIIIIIEINKQLKVISIDYTGIFYFYIDIFFKL